MCRPLAMMTLIVASSLALTIAREARSEPPPALAVLMPRPAQAVELPGSSGQVTSLQRALELFRHGNLELVAARYDLEASRADIIAAGVIPNPSVSLGAAFLAHGHPQGGRQSYQVVYDQVLPIAGQVGLRKDVAREYATAAERDFAATAWSLSSDVRDSYVDLQVAQAKWRLLTASMIDLEKVESIISQRASAGANPEYDRLRVVVERSNLAGRVAEAAGDLAMARTALAQAIGRGVDPRTLVAEEAIPEAPDPPENLEALVARSLQQRPEVGAARTRASAANLRISQVRREYYPSPDVQLGYNYWTNLPDNGQAYTGSALLVGVGIPLPLFDHGQGRIDRAAAEEQAFRTRAQSVELAVRRDTMRAAQTMKARVESWRRYRDTTAGQVERLRGIAESAYREGKSGILELLDAYRAYLEAKERALDLKAQAWKTTLGLERAIGPETGARN
ncbi:MAG: TolC family protein [Deltaproteobacteria bacterium]|nr:TolC family protein [Deltaproteobacteria bacterium]